MRNFVALFVLGSVMVCCTAQRSAAIVAFKKQFEKLYLSDETDAEFAKLVKSNKTGCLVCHQGKKRKHHNAYGVHLLDLLDKKEDAKDKEKIIAALKQVEGLLSDPEDENSPTYGDLIRSNQLPGGPLEVVQQEPEGSEESEE